MPRERKKLSSLPKGPTEVNLLGVILWNLSIDIFKLFLLVFEVIAVSNPVSYLLRQTLV